MTESTGYTYANNLTNIREALPARAIREVFEVYGFTWIVHGAPLGGGRFSRKRYQVTEESTGLRLPGCDRDSADDVKDAALGFLADTGEDRTAHVIASVLAKR